MKKILFVTALFLTIVLFSLDSSSELPKDANTNPIQSGRYVQMYCAADTARTSPMTVATGADTTLTVPENAVEIIINPDGTAITYEIGSYSFKFDSSHPFPCSGVDTIKLGNDSGGNATIYFYFNML